MSMKTKIIWAVFITVLVVALGLAVAPAAKAAQPYGGCKEAWQAPTSQGAADCRAQGWTITDEVVVNPRGVIKVSGLRDCAVATSLPCSRLGGLDSGWLELDELGMPIWHSVWMHGPRGRWHWASKAEQVRYHLLPSNQVKRRHGVVTWFRGPTGERWANVPGTDSEHWPDGQRIR